jgi:hypothetical protein
MGIKGCHPHYFGALFIKITTEEQLENRFAEISPANKTNVGVV